MTLDPTMLKIRRWAQTGDRTDPDDSSLSPALTETNGWPATFSAEDGSTPRRRVMNELFFRLTTAAVELLERGIYEWHAQVDYQQHAIVQRSGSTFKAKVATGPTTSNATDPATDTSNTVWDRASSALGTSTTPEAPARPTAVTGDSELTWTWNCPLDNGAAVTAFIFQWRVSGGAWSTGSQVTQAHSLYRQTGLTNGTTYEVRVKARNSNGDSDWSATGSAAPTASTPEQPLSLSAAARIIDATLTFPTPNDGGDAILDYQVQWKSGTQQFSSGRQRTASGSPYTLTGLTPETTYQFRVRARNSNGTGPWSPTATATTGAVASGSAAFQSAGTFSWIVPDFVTSIDLRLDGPGGSGGGGGGAGGNTQDSNGNTVPGGAGSSGGSGGSGSATTVEVAGTTYSAGAGSPGSGGRGGRLGSGGTPGANGSAGSNGSDAGNGNGGTGGGGGGGANGDSSHGSSDGGSGGSGGRGARVTQTGVTVTPGSTITVTVGDSGPPGSGGGNGANSIASGSGSSGGKGEVGNVLIEW